MSANGPTKVPTEIVDVRVGEKIIKIEQRADIKSQVQAALLSDKMDAPYWAIVWPSAHVTAFALGMHGRLDGKRVIELGGGVGTLALAAAALGADDVISADYVAEAKPFVERNATRNDLNVKALTMDWNEPPEDLGLFDGIVAADVLYGDNMLRGVLRFIGRHLKPDGQALIADPDRVMVGGISGAARLHGLSVVARPVPLDLLQRTGLSSFRGVTLYELTRGRR
jgi:predicted nicotinamide N-methyase